MDEGYEGVVSKEINVLIVIKNIGKKNKQLQAKLLQELEKYMEKDSPDYEELRKYILDEVNGYTRSVVREIFGPIEFMM